MILYRLTSREYARDLSGAGSMLFGGRWNSPGVRMLYTSATVSLATLEVLANLSSSGLKKQLQIVELDFPDHLPIETTSLPAEWNVFPYSQHTVAAGNTFIANRGLCLKVPSAIVPSEWNYLLNPAHEKFDLIRILDSRPMILDKRLLS